MKRRNGYTLVEVVISMMLTAVMVSAVFSVALTGQTSSNKVDRHVLVNQYTRHLNETLAQYVTGDSAVSTTSGNIAGPNGITVGAPSWSLTGVLGEDQRSVTDACPGGGSACWALAAGTHTVAGFLPWWFENPPYNATLKYYVQAQPAGAGMNANLATVTINWTEP